MKEVINYTYKANDLETRLFELQRECKYWMELIEDYKQFENDPRVTKEEYNEAMEEAEAKLAAAENEIIKLTWRNA